jgi:hypothetical protein
MLGMGIQGTGAYIQNSSFAHVGSNHNAPLFGHLITIKDNLISLLQLIST